MATIINTLLLILGTSVCLQAQNPTYFNKIYGGSDTIDFISTAAKPLGANYYVFGTCWLDNLKQYIYMRKIDQLGNTIWLKNLDSTIVGQNYIGIIESGGQIIISRDQHFIITRPRSNSPGYDEQHISLMKVDTMGQIIWQRTYENPNPAYARSIIQTSDGGYAMVGTIASPPIDESIYYTPLFYFIKTDSEGYLQQEYTYEMGVNAQAFSVQELPDKGYIISGWGVYESVLSDTGFVYIGSDAYVVRIKANGDTLWTHHYGEAGDDFACKVTLLANNEILLSGANKIPGQGIAKLWLARLDTLGNTLWDSTYVQLANTNSYETTIIQKPNGNIVGGAYSYTPTGYPSITQLLEIDPLGNIVYMKALTLPDSMLENNSHVYIKDMQATPDGGYIFAGYKYFQPPQLSWVLKTDSLGNTCSFVGCDSTIYTGYPIGLTQIANNNNWSVTPNPSSEQVFITPYFTEKSATFILYNLLGQVVRQVGLGSGTVQVSVLGLPAGTYFYQIINPQKQILQHDKLIVLH